MRRVLIYIIIFNSFAFYAQRGFYINGSDASLIVTENSYLTVDGNFENLNCDPVNQVRFTGGLNISHSLVNNDFLKFFPSSALNAKKSRITFYKSPTPFFDQAVISGSISPQLWEVEIDKTSGGYITLETDVNVLDTVTFKTGVVYLNGRKWILVDPVGAPSVQNHPWLKNERNGSDFRVISPMDTGSVNYTTIYNSSVNINPANIGVEFFGLMNIGSPLVIKRGFNAQIGAAKGGGMKYFDIYSPGHKLTNTVVNFKISFADFNHSSLTALDISKSSLFISPLADMDWTRLPSAIQSTPIVIPTNFNGIITASLSDLRLPYMSIDSTQFRITVADPDCLNPPLSSFNADTLYLCAGTSTIIDAGNNVSIANTSNRYEWSLNPSTYQRTLTVNPTSNFQKYKVKIMDVKGCVNYDSIYLAPAAPFPQISYFNYLNACEGDSISIKDTVSISSGTFSNFWSFSDGSTSTTLSQNFKKKFLNVGTHAIQLTSTSNFGCTVSTSATNILVYANPISNFTTSLNCANKTHSFTNNSVSNDQNQIIISSVWNFGLLSGINSIITSPTTTYAVSGTYTVKLISTTNFGCRDTASIPLVVHPYNQANFTKNNSCLYDTVYLSNTSICNTGNCDYTWDLGDATQNTNYNINKVYSSAGLYLVKLKVTAQVSCPDSVTRVLFINARPNALFAVSNSSACINEAIYFTNNSSIALGAINSYSWNYGNSNSGSGLNGNESYNWSGLYNVSLIAVSDSGCVSTRSVNIFVQPQPIAQYVVSSICEGQMSQFISSSSGQNISHLWDFGNNAASGPNLISTQNYIYPLSGNYNTQLIVTSLYGCSDTATVIANVLPKPIPNLGTAIASCGESYILNAGNPGANYSWFPAAQTTQTIAVSTSGNYQVVTTFTNGCFINESIQVTLNTITKPSLGNDTIVCGKFILDAGYPGSNFVWNNNLTSQKITVANSGTYMVTLTDQNGCVGADTILITVNELPILDLGKDLVICKPKAGYTITATTNANQYSWNNGFNTPTFVVKESASYWLEVTGTNNCKKRDSINISFLDTPEFELGPSKTNCGALTLDAQKIGYGYLWSNGQTSHSVIVTASDLYWLQLTDPITNCYNIDTIEVVVHPLVNLFLGNDSSICDNSNFKLDAKNENATYHWLGGQNTQTIPVSSSAVYGVTVTNSGGCFSTDYVNITLKAAPQLNLGSKLRYICGSVPLTIKGPAEMTYQWGSEGGLNTTEQNIVIERPGKYWLNIKQLECSASDTVFVAQTNDTVHAYFLASTIDTVNKAVQFVNLSQPESVDQTWYFGDGVTSIVKNPFYTYSLPNNYTVSLEVSNGYCADKISKSLDVLFRENGIRTIKNIKKLEVLRYHVYPNPSSQKINFKMELNEAASVNIKIVDLAGRIISMEQIEYCQYLEKSIVLNEFSNGLYIIEFRATNDKGLVYKATKFIKTN